MSGQPPQALDVAQLMAEVEAEARERRQRGDLPAGFEQELDRVFARFAPVGAVHEDFAAVLDKVEEAAFIDPTAPTASDLPGGTKVKATIQRLVGWQLDYVLRQIGGFHHSVVRAMRQLDARLTAVEESVGPGVVAPPLAPVLVDDASAAVVIEALTGVGGRVVHADAADGSLVERLVDAGIDAFGAEPSTDAALAAAARGIDVRNDAAIDFLGSVPDAGLAGLVLSGCVDRLARAAQVSLAGLAARKLAPAGVLVLLATDPDAWARTRSPVEVDLAPGRPLHAETWRHLLEHEGLEVGPPRSRGVAGEYALVARRV